MAKLKYTNLCEPANGAFQAWLDSISTVQSTGVICDAPKKPLILVHGFQGFANLDGDPNTNGYHCSNDGFGSNDIVLYDGDNPNSSTLGPMPNWFLEDYQVWIAHLETAPGITPDSTPSLQFNSECLRDQINYVHSVNPQPITIVAHSMGGVVSRAAIGMVDAKTVDSLYTMGSPHAGLPTDIFKPLPLACDIQVGMCNMSVSSMMLDFNPSHHMLKDIEYNFIGGNGGNGFDKSLRFLGQGENDGLIGKYSSVGWLYPFELFVPYWAENNIPEQYWTDEVHTDGDAGFAYYEERLGGTSHAFQCISALMNGDFPDSGICENANVAAQGMMQSSLEAASTTISGMSEISTGSLADSESISVPINIDTAGETYFNLSWGSGKFELTLTRPDAEVIDPAYATADPTEATYEVWGGSPESVPFKSYYLPNAMAGEWQLNITATSAGDYWAYAMLTSGYTLDAVTDKDSYAMGDTATITATIEKDSVGLSGQTVTATLTNQDGSVDTVALVDQGDGTYTNTYLIPNIPGYLQISVDADGNDAGTLFTRYTSLQVTVQPEDADYTGAYTETGDDTNADGLYETLDFDVEIDVAEAGDYALSANLYAGSEFVAHTGDFFTSTSGVQTVTLPFNGTTIRNSGLDGPYTVTNVLLIPTNLGLLTASGNDVLTTTAYAHTDFGTCYELTLSYSGNGTAPTPSPVNSIGCAAGKYVEDEIIDLTANPDSDWMVDRWNGTDDDSSTELANVLTMPENNHAITVTYAEQGSNDFIEFATEITEQTNYQNSISTVNATWSETDPVLPDQCGIVSNDKKGQATVWYKYYLSSDDAISINTLGSGYDTFIAIWEKPDVGELRFVACNDDANSTTETSAVAIRVTGGKTYYIEIGQP